MSDKFTEREKSFEKKFARDEELQFKIAAKRNKYLGQWVSEKKWTSLMKKLSLILFSLLIFLILSTLSFSIEKVISGKAKVIGGDTIKINEKK